MASATFLLESANKSLREEGFVNLIDSAVGEYILEIESKGFPYLSGFGLDFYRQRVLEDAVGQLKCSTTPF